MKISIKSKRKIFKLIISETSALNLNEDILLEFLNEIWDLKSMPSEDDRFKNAEGDIFQHMINNYDWDIEYLFEERLKLYEGDEIFVRFIEAAVNPKFRVDEDEVLEFVLSIDEVLQVEDLQLSIIEYDDDGNSVYKVKKLDKFNSLPIDVKQNTIPFFVEKNPSVRVDRIRSHTIPSEFPSFVLVFNDGWNDFGSLTQFYLFFYDEDETRHRIDYLKIMNSSDSVRKKIPEKFYQLDQHFCSLGQDIEFYQRLSQFLEKDFMGALYALKDAAFFSHIQEEFESHPTFGSSLIRNNQAERILREAKHLVNEVDLDNFYSFSYAFKPGFSDEAISIGFNFEEVDDLPNRVYALIGKNGTGKTQLMSSLPISISEKKNDLFSPRMPLFSKVIAVSYSIFDTFKIPKRTATFNYVYCGLKNEKGEFLSEKGLILRFHSTWKKIREMERMEEWRRILLNFLDEDLVNEFIVSKSRTGWDVSIEGFNRVRKKLSSGQGIILYIISQIVANIRYDSLLLFDEPEIHLHPNAITQLMNTIYSLVEEFQSYCILATHSPLIVRECFSRNVYVIERHENTPSVRKIATESFGENLAVLTADIFGNKDVPMHYKKVIRELVEARKSYDQIIEFIESDNVPLNLNSKIYIRSLINTLNA